MTAVMTKGFNEPISITKGICIILMVIGHSGCPECLGRFIYLFHMPVFFFVSGYLFKEKYMNDAKSFIIRKCKTLYGTFVLWSLIYLTLHNCFALLGIYNNFYTWRDIAEKAFHIFTLTGSEQLLGGFWFLKELLYASIISFFIIKAVPSPRLIPTITGVVLVSASILSFIPFKIPTIGSLTLLSTSMFLAGYIIRKKNLINKLPYWCPFVGFVLLFVTSLWYSSEMKDATGIYTYIYFALALIGFCSTLRLSHLITCYVGRLLSEIGQLSLYVLIFHFSAFKLFTLARIWIQDIPMYHMADFPVIHQSDSWSWTIYTILGVGLPCLIIRFIFRKSNVS